MQSKLTTEEEITTLIGGLAAAYPSVALSTQALKVYVNALLDISPELLAAAVNQLLAQSKFFPSVAEIRQMCLSLTSTVGRLPTGMEAWGEVLKQIRETGYYGQPYFENALIAKAVQAIGWQNLCSSENQVADRAHFAKVYDAMVIRAELDAKWLPASREMIRQVDEAREVKELMEAPAPLVDAVGPTTEFMEALQKFAGTKAMPED